MESWKAKPRVLIVDDDDEFISDLKILLSSEFEVNGVTGTRQAKEMLDSYCPDCLLLDLNMPVYFGNNPGMEGLSFLKHIRTDAGFAPSHQMPVIVLTARSELGDLAGAKELGVSKLYQKPPDIKRLKTAIWNLVESANRDIS